MCGIVSIISKDNIPFPFKMIKVYKEMLYANALRGWDSTGIASIKNREVVVTKDNISSGAFFSRYKDSDWDKNGTAFIGHNRAATKGEKTKENSHPFTEGKITLVHNGTLDYHRGIKNVDVDSHAICHGLNESKTNTILENLSGAFALVWYNKDTNSIYAIRNEERPLSIVETKEHYIIISEPKLAEWILDRNGIEIKSITTCVPGTQYKFNMNSKNIQIKTETHNLKKKQVQQNIYQYGNYGFDKPDYIEGDTVQVTPYLLEKLNYHAYNKYDYKWLGLVTDDPSIEVEMYTNNNFDMENIECVMQVISVRKSFKKDNWVITGSFKEIFIEDKEIKDDSSLYSKNGVKLTPKLVDSIKHCFCTSCSSKFIFSTNIAVVPKEFNGHIYGYSYYCPECTSKEIYKKDVDYNKPKLLVAH